MRISIPGLDGVYFDTDAESSALALAFTAAGRRAPKPHGYAVQLLPHLWSFDVDLREVPNGHPVQYLHPEGARSLGELSGEGGVRRAGTELERVLRFVWAVNQQVESATGTLIGHEREAHDGVTIEIDDGSVGIDGDELETDEFDIDDGGETTIDIEDDPTEQPGDSADPDHEFGDDSDRDLDEY
ncbi:hypothetical protein GWG54_17545 [Natronococcus sp. JC468]|uniref:hypothetical protein n=1 Tax=Natronococcus sp. JC468 TaxID=1961921 RepID=UPI00143AB7C0|nr:hypothetical protein [Natronococcus sp. JC468]NKE37575.1 hypothetical protein [Natronococcus sp. JC468]